MSFGHAHHFLSRVAERTSRSQADFALALYRDVEMVQWIIQYAHVPKSAERVALAIDTEGNGPFVVVTTDGHFVTALGAGMSTGQLPVISRAQVDEYMVRHTRTREGMGYAKRVVAPGKEPVDVLRLLGTRPHELSREEFMAITGFQPILWAQMLIDAFKASTRLEETRDQLLALVNKKRGPELSKDLLLAGWRLSHAVGPYLILGTMGDLVWVDEFAANIGGDAFGFAYPATRERLASIALQGAWATARAGEPLLASSAHFAAKSDDHMVRWDGLVSAVAIALRDRRLIDRAREVVTDFAADETFGAAWTEQATQLAIRALDDPDGSVEEAVRFGRARVFTNLVARGDHRFTEMDHVPRDVALLAAVNDPEADCMTPLLFNILPYVARLERPEDLFIPEEHVPLLREPVTLERVVNVLERHRVAIAPERRVEKPGRNEACSCGSGKKYKKCCGK